MTVERKSKMNEVSVELTYDCTMKCIMCSSAADHPSPLKNELSFNEVKKIFSDGRKFGAKVASLSGGEPAVASYWKKLIKYLREIGYQRVLIYTTGTYFHKDKVMKFTDEDLQYIEKNGVTLIFDYQSCVKETHNKIFGVDFDALAHTEEVLIKAIAMGIEVETHFVPQLDNVKDLEKTILHLINLGVKKISMLRLVPQGRCQENKHIQLNVGDFYRLQLFFNGFKRKHPQKWKHIRLGHPIDWQFLVDPTVPITACRGGTDAPLIKPDGQVDMCPAWKGLPFVPGNVRDRSIEEIYEDNDSWFGEFREFIKSGYKEMEDQVCQKCPWFHKCKGGCPAQRLYQYMDQYDHEKESLMSILKKLPRDPGCPYGRMRRL